MSDDESRDALVTTEWLAEHLGGEDVRVVDGTWHLPHLGRDALREFTEERTAEQGAYI